MDKIGYQQFLIDHKIQCTIRGVGIINLLYKKAENSYVGLGKSP